jgi:hypothetical protein
VRIAVLETALAMLEAKLTSPPRDTDRKAALSSLCSDARAAQLKGHQP